ncbi:MAG: hypothetical protein JSW47_20600, partial [Phycisphaerales bacterium]
AQLRFENVSDEPIAFYHQAGDAAKHFAISNDSGQTLEMEPVRNRRSRRRKGASSPVQTIAPGNAFETQIEGKIVAASEQDSFDAGQFRAVYSAEVSEQTLSKLESAPGPGAWTGRVSSGTYTVSVTSPEQEGCIDCHGGTDYHHVKVQQCTNCHVGQVGKPDFDLKSEACAACHPRTGFFGHRTILGPKGEFAMASKHIAGTIEDKDCLRCHDHSNHQNGQVSLIDPDSGGKHPWTGSRTDFCLVCHDGDPPEGISFPETSQGTGFDKMMSRNSTLAQTKEGCSYCHTPHGSPYPALLKNLHTH